MGFAVSELGRGMKRTEQNQTLEATIAAHQSVCIARTFIIAISSSFPLVLALACSSIYSIWKG